MCTEMFPRRPFLALEQKKTRPNNSLGGIASVEYVCDISQK